MNNNVYIILPMFEYLLLYSYILWQGLYWTKSYLHFSENISKLD